MRGTVALHRRGDYDWDLNPCRQRSVEALEAARIPDESNAQGHRVAAARVRLPGDTDRCGGGVGLNVTWAEAEHLRREHADCRYNCWHSVDLRHRSQDK